MRTYRYILTFLAILAGVLAIAPTPARAYTAPSPWLTAPASTTAGAGEIYDYDDLATGEKPHLGHQGENDLDWRPLLLLLAAEPQQVPQLVLVEVASVPRYRFQGREYDAHRADYYFRMRTYAPEWGAFTGPDMHIDVYDEFGAGSYVAFANNPLVYRDPLGLYDELAAATILVKMANRPETSMPDSVRARLTKDGINIADPHHHVFGAGARKRGGVQLAMTAYNRNDPHDPKWTVFVPDPQGKLSSGRAAQLALGALVDEALRETYATYGERYSVRGQFLWDPRNAAPSGDARVLLHYDLVPGSRRPEFPDELADRQMQLFAVQVASLVTGSPAPTGIWDALASVGAGLLNDKVQTTWGDAPPTELRSLNDATGQGTATYVLYLAEYAATLTDDVADGYFPVYGVSVSERLTRELFEASGIILQDWRLLKTHLERAANQCRAQNRALNWWSSSSQSNGR